VQKNTMKSPAKKRKERLKTQGCQEDKRSHDKQKFTYAVIFFIVLSFIFLTSSYAQDLAAATDDVYPKVSKTLENGLQVVLEPRQDQDLVAFELLVKTGSIHEGKWLGSGICHLLEHMIFKGSPDDAPGSLESKIRDMGGVTNGYTSYDMTGYTLSVPSIHFEKALELLSEMIRNPFLDADHLEKEKQVVISEIKLNFDDPARYLNRIFWQKAFAVEPYNLPVLGAEPLLEKLTRDDLKSFHDKWYIPNNMVLSVVGNVAPDVCLKKINRYFGDFPMQNYPVAYLPDVPALGSNIDYAEEYALTNSRMMLGFPSVELWHEDSAVLDVIASYLGGSETSALHLEAVKKLKLAHNIYTYNYTPMFKGVFVIGATLENKNKIELIKVISTQIDRLKTTLISKDELKKIKNSYLSSYAFARESLESKAKILASDIARMNNPDFTREYLAHISKITAQDIQKVSRKYFDPSRTVSVSLKPKGVKQEVVAPQRFNKGNLRKIVLDNGVRVVLKKNPAMPLISVQAVFLGGSRFENENDNGIFNLMSRMLLKGTKKRNSEQIARTIEMLGADIDVFSGYNSFGLTLDTLSTNFDPSFEIFADLLLNPVFPKKEFELEQELISRTIENQNDDIFRNSVNKLKSNLFEKLPYRFNTLGTKDTMASITRNDLKKLYRKFSNAQDMVISVCGDFDEEAIVTSLKKKFSKIKYTDREAAYFDAEVLNQLKLIENPMDKEQAILLVGFQAVASSSEDRDVFELINGIFSGSGSILWEKIRETYGYSYAQGASFVYGLDGGYFLIYIATKPENLDETKTIVLSELRALREKLLDEDMISKAKNYLIGEHLRKLQTNSSIAFFTGLDELYGLGFKHHETFPERIRSISARDIKRVAGRYLNTEKCVIVLTKEKF